MVEAVSLSPGLGAESEVPVLAGGHTGVMSHGVQTEKVPPNLSVHPVSGAEETTLVRKALLSGGGGRAGEARHGQQRSTSNLAPASPSLLAQTMSLSGGAVACFITLIAVWFAFIKETAGIPN